MGKIEELTKLLCACGITDSEGNLIVYPKL